MSDNEYKEVKYIPIKKKTILYRFLKCCVGLTIFLLLFTILLLFFVSGPLKKYQSFARNTISNSVADDFRNYDTSYIYNDEDELITTLSDSSGKGDYLLYDQIPKDCINALIAVEDRTFFQNKGYDIKGIIRVLYYYVKSGGKEVSGASTITQQLVRLQYLSQEKTLDRKFKEIFCAIELTNTYSKEEIMEFYVNNCYFANGIYGIEGASKYYFGKSANELSLSQIAYLCAIPNRPSYYDPKSNPENALQRRNKILSDMLECRYINIEQYNEAVKESIIIKKETKTKLNDYQASYAISCTVKFLMKKNGFKFIYDFKSDEEYEDYQDKYNEAYKKAKEKLYRGGYVIQTSLNSNIQDELQNSINSSFYDTEKDKDGTYLLQGAATVIDNETGKVVAIVGGREQNTDCITLNRAFQSYRQPGSAIKPLIVYTPALEMGYTPDSTVYDINVDLANHSSEKISSMSGEAMTLRYALENSKNGVAYSLFNEIGVSRGLSYLIDMNFAKIVPDDYSLSSSLGGFTYGTNTVEMAAAYACLTNDGVYKEPTCIVSIKNKEGEELYKESDSKSIYDPIACEEVIDVMKGVLTNGTAKSLYWDDSSDMPAAGKTGTTNDNKDGWFCGMTPYYTISVWVGYDTPKSLDSLQGSSYPALIWKKAMLSLTADKSVKNFSTKALEEKWDNETYLPGRDDSEVIGDGGYTVKNYRDDREIGEKIQAIIDDMEELNIITDDAELVEMYSDALNLLEQIISRNYKAEMKTKIEETYNEKQKEEIYWPIFSEE